MATAVTTATAGQALVAGPPLPSLRDALEGHNLKDLEAALSGAVELTDGEKETLKRMNWESEGAFLSAAFHAALRAGKRKVATFLGELGADPNGQSFPLLDAINQGEVATVGFLLDQGADPSAFTREGRPILFVAYEKYQFTKEDPGTITTVLLEGGARLGAIDKRGETILHKAIRAKDWPFAKYLVEEKRVDPNQGGKISPLALACSEDNEEMVDVLLAHRSHVNPLDDHTIPPLQVACEKGALSVIPKLLTAGADPNAKNLGALEAAYREHPRSGIPQMLVENGLDVRTIDQPWPLIKALQHSHVELLRTFLGQLSEEKKSEFLQRPVLAKAVPNFEMVRLLLEEGATVLATDEKGETAFHKVCRMGNYQTCFPIIVRYKGTTWEANRDGYTPVHLAVQHGHYGVAEHCISRLRAPWKPKLPEDRNTLLHQVCLPFPRGAAAKTEEERAQFARYLITATWLSEGMRVNELNRGGETALDLAAKSDFKRLGEVLVEFGGTCSEDHQEWVDSLAPPTATAVVGEAPS